MIKKLKNCMWRAFNGDADITYIQNFDIFQIKILEGCGLTTRDLYTILEEDGLELVKLYSQDNRITIDVRFV